MSSPTTPNAIPPSGTQVQSVIVNNQVTLTRPEKSPMVAFLLALLFGPLGMLYSTVLGALVMFVVDAILVVPTFGFVFFVTIPIGCIWAALAAR